jgi:ADP-heptose:LPS heptosyltransferase
MSRGSSLRSVRRILVVALDNLGDLVFASALTPPLRKHFPDATIDVWCKAYTAPIAALFPHVSDVVAADPFWAVRPGQPRPPIAPFVRSVAEIRRRGYDVALLSEAPWRACAAVAATGIPIRVGLARHRNAPFLTRVLPAENPALPVVLEQARLLAALQIDSPNPRYRLDVTRLNGVRNEIERRLPRRLVAIHPFAAVDEKRGPLAHWRRVADVLRARGRAVLWIGTSAELEELHDRRGRPDEVFVDTFGTSLEITAAALSFVAVFVGHDSGPLHIANAFGVPVVDVFVTGTPVRYGPQGDGPARVLFYSSRSDMNSDDILRAIDDVSTSGA